MLDFVRFIDPDVHMSRCSARLQHGAIAAAMGTPARQLRAPTARCSSGLSPYSLALVRRSLHRYFRGLGKQTRIFTAKYDPAEANRGLDLRLPKRPIGIAGMTQRIK